ncbi:MAG: tail fiber domain-containing protein [Bacteroidota bacterium]
MKKLLPFLACLLAGISLFSQTTSNIQQPLSVNSTGTAADPSAQLDVSANNKGMLVPRMTTMQRTAITAANALLVFDSDTKSFWFFDSAAAAWREIRAGNIATLQDADGNTKVQVEKNPNEDIIRFDLGGTENMVLRKNAGGSPRLELTNAQFNTFVGEFAGNANTSGFSNTANGRVALYFNTTGGGNTANGLAALILNTSGSFNSANGFESLRSNTTGGFNTASGTYSLYSNTTGSNNTALGHFADVLSGNLTNATAIGYNAKVGASNSLVLGGTGTEAVNVGIGKTSPEVRLHAHSADPSGTNGIVGYFQRAGAGDVGISFSQEGVIAYGIMHPVGGGLEFYRDRWPGGAGTLQMKIADSGNVGIGTPTPTSKLDVEGGLSIGATYSGTSAAPTNGAIIEGNVGIGTPTPSATLDVKSATPSIVVGTAGGGDGALYFGNTAHGVKRNYINGNDVALFTTAGDIILESIGTGIAFMVLGNNGNVGIGRFSATNKLEVEGAASKSSAGDWLANSDARLKKNIQPLNSQLMLQSLLALRGVTYEWNDDKTGSKRPEGIQYGFTAQNIREVFPTLVEEDKLGYLQTAYGTYDAMTVEAIRALNEENQALKAQVETLTSQLDKITAALAGAGIAVEK